MSANTSLAVGPTGFDLDVPLAEQGPAPTKVVVAFGFWLFLLSDIVIFAALFAAYGVLSSQVADGSSAAELFDKRHALVETLCLLASSVSCGLLLRSYDDRRQIGTYFWSAVTFALGLAFLILEIREFAGLVHNGSGPSRSAFLSSFYALVGTHGLHVSLGLLWLLVMIGQVATFGFQSTVRQRIVCFSLFWHALDIVWVGVFTIVYLGAHG